jgi:hypothetical protein
VSGDAPARWVAQLGLPDGDSFIVPDGEDFADVRFSIAARDFELGADGDAALFLNEQFFAAYNTTQVVSLPLPPGRHVAELRLRDLSGDPAFPDARRRRSVFVSTTAAPSLSLVSPTAEFAPFDVVELQGGNLFALSEVYAGELNGAPVELAHDGEGGFAFLVPEMADFEGVATLHADIEGVHHAVDLSVIAPAPIADPYGFLDDEITDRRAALDAAIGRLDPVRDWEMIAALQELDLALIAFSADLSSLSGEDARVLALILRASSSASGGVVGAQSAPEGRLEECAARLERTSENIRSSALSAGATEVSRLNREPSRFARLEKIYNIYDRTTTWFADVYENIDDCAQVLIREAFETSGGASGMEISRLAATSLRQFRSDVPETLKLEFFYQPEPEVLIAAHRVSDALAGMAGDLPGAGTLAALFAEFNAEGYVQPASSNALEIAVLGGEAAVRSTAAGAARGDIEVAVTAAESADFTLNIRSSAPSASLDIPAQVIIEPPQARFSEHTALVDDEIRIPLHIDGRADEIELLAGPPADFGEILAIDLGTREIVFRPGDQDRTGYFEFIYRVHNRAGESLGRQTLRLIARPEPIARGQSWLIREPIGVPDRFFDTLFAGAGCTSSAIESTTLGCFVPRGIYDLATSIFGLDINAVLDFEFTSDPGVGAIIEEGETAKGRTCTADFCFVPPDGYLDADGANGEDFRSLVGGRVTYSVDGFVMYEAEVEIEIIGVPGFVYSTNEGGPLVRTNNPPTAGFATHCVANEVGMNSDFISYPYEFWLPVGPVMNQPSISASILGTIGSDPDVRKAYFTPFEGLWGRERISVRADGDFNGDVAGGEYSVSGGFDLEVVPVIVGQTDEIALDSETATPVATARGQFPAGQRWYVRSIGRSPRTFSRAEAALSFLDTGEYALAYVKTRPEEETGFDGTANWIITMRNHCITHSNLGWVQHRVELTVD